jgi:DNA-binding response OmpR family regulator
VLDRVRSADGLASRLDPDLPVIALTGRSGEADRVRSFARGADDHLSKPTCHFPPRLRAQFEVRASSIRERRSSNAATLRRIAAPLESRSVTPRFCSSCGGETLVGVG